MRIKTGSFRASTLNTYANIIEADLRPMWGAEPIRRFTREDVGDYRARLTDRDLAASTLNQTRAIVRGIFAVAVERYELEDDVSIAFKRAKTRRATSEKISFYPPEEVDLRKSSRVRSVPLMPQVALALTGLRRRGYFTGDDELVFVNEVGDVLGYDALIRRYRTAQTQAGVRRLRVHDLRHSFGTMAVRQFPITDDGSKQTPASSRGRHQGRRTPTRMLESGANVRAQDRSAADVDPVGGRRWVRPATSSGSVLNPRLLCPLGRCLRCPACCPKPTSRGSATCARRGFLTMLETRYGSRSTRTRGR